MHCHITATLLLITVSVARNDEIASINNDYAFKMHRTLIAEDSNVVTSPISYLSQLGILQLVSDGNTAYEIRRSIGYNTTTVSGEQVHDYFRELIGRLGNQSRNTFKMANVAILRSDFPPTASSKIVLKHFYNVSIQPYDIYKATETMKSTNKLVREATDGAFQQFLSSPLDSYNRLALLNALYFSGTWKYQFHLRPSRFYNRGLPQGSSLRSMMSVGGVFPFASLNVYGTNLTAVELPYADDDLRVLFLLPRDKGMQALIKIEQQMTANGLSGVLSSMRERSVSVTLPSFRLEPGHDLMWSVQFLGVRDAFNNAANFRGLSREKGLFVTKVLHKMAFEMNARGARAWPDLEKAEESFVADRPFLFFVRDTRTDMILFMGRIVSLA